MFFFFRFFTWWLEVIWRSRAEGVYLYKFTIEKNIKILCIHNILYNICLYNYFIFLENECCVWLTGLFSCQLYRRDYVYERLFEWSIWETIIRCFPYFFGRKNKLFKFYRCNIVCVCSIFMITVALCISHILDHKWKVVSRNLPPRIEAW